MQFSTIVLTITAATLMTGCSSVVSLNPVANPSEVLTDNGLPGVWDTGDKDGSMFVIRPNGASYTVVFTEKSSPPAKFEARLFRAGDAKLLDLVTTEEDAFQVPVHVLVRVWPEGSTLRWAFLDSDWFKHQVHGNLANQAAGDRTLVTAPGAVVRAFVEKYGTDERAYSKPQSLSKMQ